MKNHLSKNKTEKAYYILILYALLEQERTVKEILDLLLEYNFTSSERQMQRDLKSMLSVGFAIKFRREANAVYWSWLDTNNEQDKAMQQNAKAISGVFK